MTDHPFTNKILLPKTLRISTTCKFEENPENPGCHHRWSRHCIEKGHWLTVKEKDHQVLSAPFLPSCMRTWLKSRRGGPRTLVHDPAIHSEQVADQPWDPGPRKRSLFNWSVTRRLSPVAQRKVAAAVCPSQADPEGDKGGVLCLISTKTSSPPRLPAEHASTLKSTFGSAATMWNKS